MPFTFFKSFALLSEKLLYIRFGICAPRCFPKNLKHWFFRCPKVIAANLPSERWLSAENS